MQYISKMQKESKQDGACCFCNYSKAEVWPWEVDDIFDVKPLENPKIQEKKNGGSTTVWENKGNSSSLLSIHILEYSEPPSVSLLFEYRKETKVHMDNVLSQY